MVLGKFCQVCALWWLQSCSITRRRRGEGAMACSKSTAARTTFHLPIDMTIDILSRLPVKSLLRFKSVCKTPDFIAKHLQTYSALNSASLLVTTYNRETRNYAMSLLSDDGFSGPIDFPFLTDSYCPYFKWDPTRIAGICNGLVCIYISRFGYPLIICNPSTRKFREIPRNWLEENGSKGCISVERVSFGFGFHPSANDYKLIRIAVYRRRPVGQYQVGADLYAMSTDMWTEIDVDKLSLFFGAGDEVGIVPTGISVDLVLQQSRTGFFIGRQMKFELIK